MYVQDILRDTLAEEVVRVLHQQAGHLYVCGSISMARGVAHTIEGILTHRLGISAQQASQYLCQMKVNSFPQLKVLKGIVNGVHSNYLMLDF